jgi:hypothetical protein
MPKSFRKHRKDPKHIRRQKPSQWQNRRREDLIKLVSNSITSCANHDSRLEGDIAICSRNVREIANIITFYILDEKYLKRYLIQKIANVSNSMPYLYERLVNYSQKHQDEIEPTIKEWTCPFFIECFQHDFHLCRHNFKDFKIAADWSEEYSQYYKSNCRKYPNALQWYFALYKEWNNCWTGEEKFNFYGWIVNKKKEIPMPLPCQKGFRWYNVDVLLQHVFRNIIEKYETDLSVQPTIYDVAFSNYFSMIWINAKLGRRCVQIESLKCISNCFPFPDRIVITRIRYVRLLSLNGMVRLLLDKWVSSPGSSLTMNRVCSTKLLRYLSGGEYLICVNSIFSSFAQYWHRRYERKF